MSASAAARSAAVAGLVAWVVAVSLPAERPLMAAAVGGLAALPLLVQARAPVTCLLAAAAGMVLSDGLGGRTTGDDPYLAMLIWSCFGIGRWAGPRRQWVAVAVAVLLTAGAVLGDESPELPGDLAFPLLFTAAPFVLGRERQQAEHQVRRLAEQAEALRRGREAELRSATQEERLRIARELHDVVAHSISAVSLQAQVLRRQAEAGRAAAPDQLAAVERTAQEAMRELRAMLGVLRPHVGAADGGVGPAAAPALSPSAALDQLPALLDRARAAGHDVAFSETGERVPLPPGLSLTAHRLVQESLVNARRHGGLGRTDVAISWTPGRLLLRVASPLRDAVPEQRAGHGLTGMRERAAAWDGRLDAGPRGDRWVVEAELPLVGSP